MRGITQVGPLVNGQNTAQNFAAPAHPYSRLDAAHRLMPLSVAWRSISRSSSAENFGLSRAPTFCSSCATLLAPTNVEVTRGSRSVQASAIWANVWPRPCAIWFSAFTLLSVWSLNRSLENDPAWLFRRPAGVAFRTRLGQGP